MPGDCLFRRGDRGPISQNSRGARPCPDHRRVRDDPATLPECCADRYDRQFRRPVGGACVRELFPAPARRFRLCSGGKASMVRIGATWRKTCSRALSRARFPPLRERRCCFRLSSLRQPSRYPRPRLDNRSLRPASNMSGGVTGEAGMATPGAGMRTVGAGIAGGGIRGAGIALSMGSTAGPSAIAGLAAGAIVTAPGDVRALLPGLNGSRDLIARSLKAYLAETTGCSARKRARNGVRLTTASLGAIWTV